MTDLVLFRQRFIGRDDRYALQTRIKDRWAYRALREHITDDVLLSHVEASRTIAVYTAADSTTKWLAIDIDDTRSEPLRRVLDACNARGLPFLVEDSGRRGFHIWLFFTHQVPNRDARRLGKLLAPGHEVFPKQERTATDRPGSAIKLPLGVHLATGRRCAFVDHDTLLALPDQWTALAQVPLVRPERIPPPPPHRRHTHRHPPETCTDSIRPCVLDALTHGITEGRRNRTAFVIAVELRRTGHPQREAVRLLTAWNTRNDPPLSQEELLAVIRSAYRRDYHVTCNPTGTLRSVLSCPGRHDCPWYRTTAQECRNSPE